MQTAGTDARRDGGRHRPISVSTTQWTENAVTQSSWREIAKVLSQCICMRVWCRWITGSWCPLPPSGSPRGCAPRPVRRHGLLPPPWTASLLRRPRAVRAAWREHLGQRPRGAPRRAQKQQLLPVPVTDSDIQSAESPAALCLLQLLQQIDLAGPAFPPERLSSLAGDAASLEAVELDAGESSFTLRLAEPGGPCPPLPGVEPFDALALSLRYRTPLLAGRPRDRGRLPGNGVRGAVPNVLRGATRRRSATRSRASWRGSARSPTSSTPASALRPKARSTSSRRWRRRCRRRRRRRVPREPRPAARPGACAASTAPTRRCSSAPSRSRARRRRRCAAEDRGEAARAGVGVAVERCQFRLFRSLLCRRP